MLGFYNITVVLTYVSLLISSVGIAAAMRGNVWGALLCLLLSGFFDMWDGMIARFVDRKNTRSKEAQRFGIQIDSLCDLVCFGVLPAVIGFALLKSRTIHGAWVGAAAVVCGLFILAALIRLAYFNVAEELRAETSTGKRAYFEGLPVTMAALIFPFVYAVFALWAPLALPWAYFALMLVACVLFLAKKLRVKKPTKKIEYLVMALIGGLVLGLLIAARCAG